MRDPTGCQERPIVVEFAGSDALTMHGWGFHATTAAQALRLKGPSPIPVDAAEATAFYTPESAYNGGLPIKVDSAEDLFEKMAESHRQASANPSGDRKWDDKFPHHPLTRVRAHQQQILSTIAVNGMSPCG